MKTMNQVSDAAVNETRVNRFDRAFPKIGNRESWLTMYLQLRDSGDDHTTAVETIRGEQLMAQHCRR